MKNRIAGRLKFTEAQIIFAIKQSETGIGVEEVLGRWGLAKQLITTAKSMVQARALFLSGSRQQLPCSYWD